MTLTLSHPDDLKVAEGDFIEEGQIISDRTRDRENLVTKKNLLLIQVEKLNQPIPSAATLRHVPPLPNLPAESFLDEVADIERRRLLMESTARSVEQQQRMLDLLQTMPEENLPQATIPHELEILRQRQQEYEQAVADMQYSEAQLDQARAERAYDEYSHAIKQSQRAIQLQQAELERQNQLQRQQQAEQDRAFKLADIQTRITQIDAQLAELGTVRAPWDGNVQRVKWEEQRDQNLLVEINVVESLPDVDSDDRPSPSNFSPGPSSE